jgi:SAM-dependent methyltransferase
MANPMSGLGMGTEPSFSPSRVARSYDRLAARYAQWADRVTPPLRQRYAEVLSARLPAGAQVLELGCGPGVPVARMLSRHFAVVGVDISWEMVRLARRNAPRAAFLQADMASVAFRPNTFAGVVAFYSLIHVSRVHHAGLLARVHRWLRPDGVLVASLGWHDLPLGTDPDWLGGGPMHWSFFDAQTNLRLLREAGLQVEEAKVVSQLEDEARVSFLWVVAHKPAGHHDQGAA